MKTLFECDNMASLPTEKSSASFWHSEPSEFLLGHRTTAALPKEVDVVIVGSGITGASAARSLAEDEGAKGLSIVMLEAREACWGATGRVGPARPFTMLSIDSPDHGFEPILALTTTTTLLTPPA